MTGISAILTAAGESTRMGRPKALLPWCNRTLVEYQIDCLAGAGVSEVIVVLGHDAELIAPSVNSPIARAVVNPDYHHGKTTSIKAGLRAIGTDAEAILLLAVDQPRTMEIISTIVEAHRRSNSPITSPRYQGRGGHPLVFAASLKGELGRISEEGQGIREVMRNHRDEVKSVEIDDPIIRLDLNTPEAYEGAKKRYGRSPTNIRD